MLAFYINNEILMGEYRKSKKQIINNTILNLKTQKIKKSL